MPGWTAGSSPDTKGETVFMLSTQLKRLSRVNSSKEQHCVTKLTLPSQPPALQDGTLFGESPFTASPSSNEVIPWALIPCKVGGCGNINAEKNTWTYEEEKARGHILPHSPCKGPACTTRAAGQSGYPFPSIPLPDLSDGDPVNTQILAFSSSMPFPGPFCN